VAQIDINAILAAIQPQIQALIQQAVAQAAANAVPPAASVPVVIAPPPIVAPTAPVQITMASTIAHIEPVLTLFNKSIAGFIPPPYNLIPLGLAGVGHIIAASSGQVQATPDSIGQAVNDIAQAGLGGALHPVATVDPAAK
jgi:hypothetical protein